MFRLRSGNKPEIRELSGIASPNKEVDASAITDKVSNVTDKLKNVKPNVNAPKPTKSKNTKVSKDTKPNTTVKDSTKFTAKQVIKKKGVQPVVQAGLTRVGAKTVARAIPGAGYGLLAADAGKLMLKQKATGYAEIDARSPGTSKHLETGAYGNQAGVRGLSLIHI